MNEDPIVAEVRQIRERRARRLEYDIHKIFNDLMTRGGANDPSHPIVKDADNWASAAAARDALILREEPPPKK